MSARLAPLRTCRNCGATWRNHTRGACKSNYCSTQCRNEARRNSNKSNKGRIPVGKRFWRSHDGAECVVLADARGLPFAEAIRELEAIGQ